MEKRYKSYFKENKKEKYISLLEKAIKALQEAKAIEEKYMIESYNNYKEPNNFGIIFNKEFLEKIRLAEMYLDGASQLIEQLTNNSTIEEVKQILVRSKLRLIGGSSVLNSTLTTSERYSGDNVNSLILDILNSTKLSTHERIVIGKLIHTFLYTCNEHNLVAIKANEIFKDQFDFEQNKYIILKSSLKPIFTIIKKELDDPKILKNLNFLEKKY